jgi:lipopolysaccharide/colanic/teichoic acid biosynthesis glycosyltransferase
MDSSSTRQSAGSIASGTAVADGPVAAAIGELGSYAAIKRISDVIASLLLLVLLSPFLLLFTILVFADSRGPVIFRQVRVGKDGSAFALYKFRTMEVDAPSLTTEEMKRYGLSYYTRVGRMLRRFSLDELPQLVNVFLGDMSLIGPRPSLPTQEWLNARREQLRVQELWPGITGWAQVSGRDELSDSEKVAYDAEYRSRFSLALDIKIAVLTVKAVFSGDGAN